MSDTATTTAAEKTDATREALKRFFGRLEVGMPVHWYETGRKGDGARVAFVYAIGETSVGLHVFDPVVRNVYRHVDGVKFIKDPSAVEHDRLEQGLFDVPEFLKLLFDVADRTATLKVKSPPPAGGDKTATQ